jgi:CHAT domain-containing protein
VYGLQRAFHTAGTRNVIATLWNIDDQASAVLMRLFYHKLWVEKKPPIEALREAQLTIYRNPKLIGKLAVTRGPNFAKTVQRLTAGHNQSSTPKSDPKHWAGFVLSGPGLNWPN